MSKLTASQDISQFLASADKVEAADILEAIKTENLLNQTLIIQADDTVKGYVGDIGSAAFAYDSTLKGLSLGSSVTTIGSNAFYDSPGFTGSLNIPNSVTTIGSGAFRICGGFTSLTIGNSVASIGDSAFFNCSGFTGSLIIGNSVTTIGSYAFYGCDSFTSVSINRAVAPTIGTDAFLNMTGVSPAVIHVPVGATGYAASYNGLTVVYDL